VSRIARQATRFGIRTRARKLVREIRVRTAPKGPAVAISVLHGQEQTPVDDYWNRHTVHESGKFMTAAESEGHLSWRASQYPLYTELMDVRQDHSGRVILDYGCGPGDDVTGFLLWSNPTRVIGMDVSRMALGLLQHRLALHRIDPRRVQLIQITDSIGKVALPDSHVDWVHCGGVLHHTTHPAEILGEFHRVMKPGSEGRLMLYNRDSVFYHLAIAYVEMIVNQAFPGLSVDEAFTRSTDGPDCPVSDAWPPQRVLDLIAKAGFDGEFRGGYVNVHEEMDWLREYGDAAKADARLAAEHRRFLSELTTDVHGYPMWNGKYAGIGAVYTIRKPA